MISKGVIYVATQEHHVREAAESQKSLLLHNPDLPVRIFTDCPEFAKQFFEDVVPLEKVEKNHIDKVRPFVLTPFEHTVFLDTDTHINGSLEELFEALINYDLLVGMDPWYHSVEGTSSIVKQFNTGVVFYRKTDNVLKFLKAWEQDYKELTEKWGFYPGDQFSFQRVLFESNLRYFVLTNNYNFRTISPNILYPECEALIIHGRQKNMASLSAVLNASPGTFKLFFPNLRSLSQASLVFPSKEACLLVRLWLFPFTIWAKYDSWRETRLVKKQVKAGEIPEHKMNPNHKY